MSDEDRCLECDSEITDDDVIDGLLYCDDCYSEALHEIEMGFSGRSSDELVEYVRTRG